MLNINDKVTIMGMTGEVAGLDRTGGKVWIKLDNGRTIWAKESDARRI